MRRLPVRLPMVMPGSRGPVGLEFKGELRAGDISILMALKPWPGESTQRECVGAGQRRGGSRVLLHRGSGRRGEASC